MGEENEEVDESARGGSVGRGILAVLVILAWSLSVVSVAHCTFLVQKEGGAEVGKFGLFSYQGDSTSSSSGYYCTGYPDDTQITTVWRSARAFGVLAALLSGFTMFLFTSLQLYWEWAVKTVWRICTFLVSMAFLFQSLTFLYLYNEECRVEDVKCTVGAAGIISAIAAVLFLVVAVMMGCCVEPPTRPYFAVSEMKNRHSAKLRWIIFGLAILSWILAVVAVADCTFIRAGTQGTKYSKLDDFGLFSYNFDNDRHQCLTYSRITDHNAAAKTARTFGVLAATLTGIVMLQVFALQLFLQRRTECLWMVIRVEMLLATVSQVLTFAAFGDESCVSSGAKCVPGPAGIISAINVLLLSVLTWLCWAMAPPDQPIFEVKLMTQEHNSEDEDNMSEDEDNMSEDQQDAEVGFGAQPRYDNYAASDEAVALGNSQQGSPTYAPPPTLAKSYPEEFDEKQQVEGERRHHRHHHHHHRSSSRDDYR